MADPVPVEMGKPNRPTGIASVVLQLSGMVLLLIGMDLSKEHFKQMAHIFSQGVRRSGSFFVLYTNYYHEGYGIAMIFGILKRLFERG